jgi:hypothetical protein
MLVAVFERMILFCNRPSVNQNPEKPPPETQTVSALGRLYCFMVGMVFDRRLINNVPNSITDAIHAAAISLGGLLLRL